MKQICRSVELCRLQAKELVLVVDREVSLGDFLWDLRTDYDFVRLVMTDAHLRGSPRARMLAIRSSKHPILLFTNDECRVPDLWVERMVTQVLAEGVVSGCVISDRSRVANFVERMEEKWDEMRFSARLRDGGARYVSFSCLGARRECLPSIPFDSLFPNSADDLDLSYRFNLSKIRIFSEPRLSVQRRYPASYFSLLALKWRQAQGVTWVHRRFGGNRLHRMEISSWLSALKCWIEFSWRVNFPVWMKIAFLGVNIFYCLGLAYFSFLFRGVASVSEHEVQRTLPLAFGPQVSEAPSPRSSEY